MNEKASAKIWRFVTGNEVAIADHLRSLASVLPSAVSQRVTCCASQLDRIHQRGGMSDSAAQEKSLANRDLLSVVSPLLERANANQNVTISESELLADLQLGVCRLVRYSDQRSSIVGLFTYPGLLVVGLIAILLMFSQIILPNFRAVIIDFGIELPVATRIAFGIGRFLETAWPLALIVAAVAALPMAIELCRSAGIALGLVQWFEGQLSSKRSAMASWARHTALLLQSGVTQKAAIETSMLAAKRWVRSNSWPWKFGLIEESIKLGDTTAKIAMLNHAADYYQSRHRSVIQWWASFLPTIFVCLLGGLVLFVLISILMPLVSIITGLSGGMF